jgi:hypothetical protein
MVQMYWDASLNVPSADNPWYNQYPKHDFNVCYDFNHESDYTKKLVDDVLRYWVTEYHVDGFRFDLSKGFTQTNSLGNVGYWGQYDQSRIDLLKRMADEIREVDDSSILILEHFAESSEEQVLSNYGFMLWSNSNFNYAQCAMGYSSSADISWVGYQSHGFSQPHAVGYMESHDEERVMYKVNTYGNHNGSYDVRPLDSALNRIKQAACFFIPVPGPKMIWQFGELGYDYSINYCQNGTINSACRVDPKPIRWDYLTYNPRYHLYKFYSAINNLKRSHPVFNSGSIAWEVWNLYKSARFSSNDMNACVIGNFDIVSGNVTPNFQHTGIWYEYFTGVQINVSNTTAAISLQPGEYRLYTDVPLPPPDLGNVGIDDPGQQHQLMLQGFPNPAGDRFTLDFFVPVSGKAQIELFDLSGRKIATITDKHYGSEWYTVEVPVGDLPGGIYLCKLSSSGLSAVLKVEIQD